MTDAPGTSFGRTVRASARSMLIVAVLGFAIHILLPQLGTFQRDFQALRNGRWPFLLLAIVGSGLVIVASAWMVRSSVSSPPGWGRTVITQLAASFGSAVTPAGLGWVTVTQSSLEHAGTDREEASAATGLNLILTVVAHIGLLIVILPLLPVLNPPRIPEPTQRIAVDIAVVAAVVLGLLTWIPRTRTGVIDPILRVLAHASRIVRDPRRSVLMAAGAVAQNLAFAFTLWACLAAFGASASPLGVLVVYMAAATIASISPTPGGLGAMEAALVAGLTRIGLESGTAVAAVLSFRFATFWIPMAAGAWALRTSRRKGWI